MFTILLDIVLIEVTLQVQDLFRRKIVFIAELNQKFVVIQLAGDSLGSESHAKCTRHSQNRMLYERRKEGCGLSTPQVVGTDTEHIKSEESATGPLVNPCKLIFTLAHVLHVHGVEAVGEEVDHGEEAVEALRCHLLLVLRLFSEIPK